MNVFIQSAAFQ